MDETSGRKYKDTFFRIVFGEKHKDNALSLYNAVNKSDYTNADDLEIYTIGDAIYMSVKNDVAFLFDDSMNLFEHQSTCNPNMPLRGLDYFAALYRKYIETIYSGHKVVFSSSIVHIPTPHYCVFYNGMRDMPEKQDIHLSDAYEGKGDLEITAHVININYGNNKELFDVCTPLAGYAELVRRVRDNIADGMTRENAIKKAIDSCIEDGILVEILTNEVNEVTDSFLAALTDQEIEELHQYELEQNRKEGFKEGREKGVSIANENIAKLYSNTEQDGRLNDFAKAMKDKDYLQQLLKEYNLI